MVATWSPTTYQRTWCSAWSVKLPTADCQSSHQLCWSILLFTCANKSIAHEPFCHYQWLLQAVMVLHWPNCHYNKCAVAEPTWLAAGLVSSTPASIPQTQNRLYDKIPRGSRKIDICGSQPVVLYQRLSCFQPVSPREKIIKHAKSFAKCNKK